MASELDREHSSNEKFLAAQIAEEQLRGTTLVPKKNFSVLQILLLGAALLLAISTTLLAGLFQDASVASSGDFKSGVTTCPGKGKS